MKLENDSKWLFKYMPFNFNAVKLLANNELWFGKPDTQNDPNEAEFILKYNEKVTAKHNFIIDIQEELDAAIINATSSGEISPYGFEGIEFERQLKKIIRDYIGICSMSVKHNDLLMWAHYADYNEGICLVFDKDILTNSFGFKKGSRITYSDSITKANFIKDRNMGSVISDKNFFMDKFNNWKYEEEYRFVTRCQDRISQNKINRLRSFPENAVVGIILGEKFPKENFKTLINLVYARNTEKEFYFWKCTKNLYKKSMNISLITGHSGIYSNQNDYIFEDILDETKNSFIAERRIKTDF